MTIDTLLSAGKGDGERRLAPVAAGRSWSFPDVQVWGDVAAVGRERRRATRRRFFAADADRGSVIGSPGTDFIWAGGRLHRRLAGKPGRERVHAASGTRASRRC